ncbi:MAG: DUF1761 domain-containing protein [Candidatus Puniceispirillaceae bacterium]
MSIIISVYWLPIIVGAGLAFALGMVWYHPSVFGTKWMAEQPHRKFPDAYQTGMKAGMIASLIDAVLVATLVTALFSILYYPGVILLGLSILAGTFAAGAFQGRTLRIWMIDAGFLMAQLAIMIGALRLLS